MKYSVKLNGRQYEVEVEKIEDDFRALTKAEVSKETASAPVNSTKQAAPSSAPASTPAPAPVPASAPVSIPPVSSGECQVLSPMPGTVLEVIGVVGQSVQAGDVIVVIEAMKMENEIVAPQAGVIDSIPVKKGDTLDTDAILAVLK